MTEEQFYVIHHQDGWKNGRPWLVCCNEEFDIYKHDSYTRFDGWNCPNESLEISENHPPKQIVFMKIDSL